MFKLITLYVDSVFRVQVYFFVKLNISSFTLFVLWTYIGKKQDEEDKEDTTPCRVIYIIHY